jgi:NADPH:quinone reductase-like Zn-dependent oxidoreductase
VQTCCKKSENIHRPPPGESTVLGLEIAGFVEAVGSAVKQWAIGDRVCALLTGGGYAAKVKVPGGLAMTIPERFSFEEAAAIPEVFLTASFDVFWMSVDF